ncbi:MAG TPA: PAS domain S-box protein [Methylomirabilota bacterium]|nr:PAS domain S-box protein [Methylomirabilota bacterium]
MQASNITPFPQPDFPEAERPRSYAAWWQHQFEEAEEVQLVCARDGVILELNRKARQQLGLAPRASLLAAPQLDEVTRGHLERVLALGEGPHETLPSVALCGSAAAGVIVDIQVSRLDPGCWLVVFRDASRRCRLEAHTQRLLSAIEATGDVIWLADADGRLTFVNPAFHTATGYAIEDVLGRPVDQLRAEGQADQIQAYKNAVAKGLDWNGEFVNRRPDGSTYQVEVSVSPIRDRQGELAGWAGFERDVSAQHRLREELRIERNLIGSIINSLEASLYALDGSLRITHFNEGWRKMPAEHGWLRLDAPPVVGRCLLDYVPDPVRRAELEKLCREVLTEGRPQEFCVLGHEGHHWVISMVPWRDAGHIRGLIFKVADNARFVAIQNQLYQAQKMQMLGTLAAGVAHDFNNLLLAIRGNAGLVLLDEKLDPGIRARLEQVDQAAARAGDLSSQLLAFSRSSEEKVTVLDFDAVVREAANLVRRTLRGRVTINVQPAARTPKVQMDSTRAQQVLLNLCINAADAMKGRGEICISNSLVTLTPEQQAKARKNPTATFLCCSVKDNGAGIPPEILPRIFSPFFTTKPKGKGTGLGLAIVHEVVTKAGGFVEVESVVGTGTTFRIYLPLDDGAISTAAPVSRTALQKGSGRLLVVDDLDLVLEFATSFLEQAGYEVLSATSADEAIRILEKQEVPIDLVLTDYCMPGKSGLQLIQEAAPRWPALRFIVASGYLDEEERARIAKVAGVRVLSKPFSIEEATRTVAEVLGRT